MNADQVSWALLAKKLTQGSRREGGKEGEEEGGEKEGGIWSQVFW